MVSILLLLSLQTLAVGANPGFVDALNYHARPPLPTGFAKVEKRQNINACSTVYNAINFCESVSPGFTTMDPTAQAPCLCYSSTSWMPNAFDGAIETCANFARTGSPSDYSAVNALNGFCTSVGNVLVPASTTRRSGGGGGGGSAGATPTACAVVGSAISYCNSVSPGFTTMPVSDQAPCLCYSSKSWLPSFFDGEVQTCADFASSASPSDYSVLVGLEGFCTSAGDVLGPAATPALTTRSTRTPTPTLTDFSTSVTQTGTPTGATGIVTQPDCGFVGSAISFCNSISPGFTTMQPSSQAPCLCYSSSTWNPSGFDGPVSSCANFVRTASPKDYSIFSNLAGFCTDVGDVFATTTAASTSRGSGSNGGGIGGLPGDVLNGPSTTSSITPTSTVTVQPSTKATPTPNAGMPSQLVNHWALLVTVTMGLFVLL